MNFYTVRSIALMVVILSAINWAFVGIFDINLVSFLFGEKSIVTRFIYTMVGLAGVYLAIFYLFLTEELLS